jgi:hypothetical protein
MPVCKLCQQEVTALVKAHVIPRSFFEIDPRLAAPRLITNSKGIYPKKIPVGVYDRTIVCGECEKRFSDCDDYAARLLLRSEREFVHIPGGYVVKRSTTIYLRSSS